MDDKKEQAITRGKRAEVLLNDTLLTEAFETLKADYIKGWEQSAPRDSDGRERVWQAVQIVGKVKDHLMLVAANGKVSQRDIDEIAQPQKRGVFNIV